MAVVEITDDTFADTIRDNPAIIVDLWAAWCGPCKMITPLMEDLSKKYDGKVLFCKMNVDENPRVAMENAIMAIPTLLLYKNGEIIDRIIGVVPRNTLVGAIDRLVD
jgi:thioredoxin 1